MGQYFLGSVGTAEAFCRNEDGELEIMFTSKTLIESGLSIGSTKDEIRGGSGASIQFSFYHDPSVELQLVDALFKTEYLEAQLGIDFSEVGEEDNESYKTVNVTFNNGVAQLDESVRPLPLQCDGPAIYVAWGSKVGDEDWYLLDVIGDDHDQLSLPDASGEYCVSYLAQDMRARVAELTTNCIPKEFSLIITAPLFEGNLKLASKSKAVGTVQFEIPRFQLDGNLDLNFEMSSVQNLTLQGIALASPMVEDDCDKDRLMRIIEVVFNRTWIDDVVGLFIDPDTTHVGDTPQFYVELKSGETMLIDLYNVVGRRSSTDLWEVLPEGYTFTETGTYYFNLFDGYEVITDDDKLFCIQESGEIKPFRVWKNYQSVRLRTNLEVNVTNANTLGWYNDEYYFF